MQFTIRTLLLFTTAVAVFLSMTIWFGSVRWLRAAIPCAIIAAIIYYLRQPGRAREGSISVGAIACFHVMAVSIWRLYWIGDWASVELAVEVAAAGILLVGIAYGVWAVLTRSRPNSALGGLSLVYLFTPLGLSHLSLVYQGVRQLFGLEYPEVCPFEVLKEILWRI
jgi:hypothetical protein